MYPLQARKLGLGRAGPARVTRRLGQDQPGPSLVKGPSPPRPATSSVVGASRKASSSEGMGLPLCVSGLSLFLLILVIENLRQTKFAVRSSPHVQPSPRFHSDSCSAPSLGLTPPPQFSFLEYSKANARHHFTFKHVSVYF